MEVQEATIEVHEESLWT